MMITDSEYRCRYFATMAALFAFIIAAVLSVSDGMPPVSKSPVFVGLLFVGGLAFISTVCNIAAAYFYGAEIRGDEQTQPPPPPPYSHHAPV